VTILQREALRARMQSRDPRARLAVSPMLDSRQLTEGSIDLRLGTDFLIPQRNRAHGIDPGEPDSDQRIAESQERVVLPLGQALWLHPGQLVLGSTLEFIHLPCDCAAYVLGRSSWGRIGLLVATAVYVQPGFAGSLTLELVNEADTPIRLRPGLRVAQLVVHALAAETKGYAARFSRAIGPEPPKVGWDRDEVKRIGRVEQKLSLGVPDAGDP
jgi:dCTP deaminase